jgi:hypothetical protein
VPPEPSLARPAGAGSTFEQFLELVPDAIDGVGREGKIVLVDIDVCSEREPLGREGDPGAEDGGRD